MIESRYILDIFELAFDEHCESELLRKQVPHLTIKEIEHTGIGAFIFFSKDNQIQEFRLGIYNETNLDTDGNRVSMIDGVEIENSNLSILADATIHLKNGIIDHLEIWNKCGKDYVLTDPEHYQLEQVWLDKNRRRRIIR